MRKINKILSSVTAATVAFGSLAAYVAVASAVDSFTVTSVAKASTAPETMTEDSTLEQYAANMEGVELTGSAGNYTVTLDKSKMTAYDGKGGNGTWFALAVTLDKEYDVTDLAEIDGINEEDVTDGYAFAGGTKPTDEAKSQYIVLWINGDTERSIEIEELELTINVEFKKEAEAVTVEVDNQIALDPELEEDDVQLEDVVTVTVTPNNTAEAGGEISVKVEVEEGYEISGLSVTADQGEVEGENGEYTVTVSGDATGTVTITISGTLVESDDGEDDGNGDDEDDGNGDDEDDGNGGDEDDGNGDDNTGDNGDDNTGDNGDDNTGDNGDDNTGDNGDDNTGDNGDDNTGDNGDDNTGDNSDDNTGDNGDDTTDDGTPATPATPAESFDGEADVTPGATVIVETDAGDVTVVTSEDDVALTGTKFVVETVEDASNGLTAAVGAIASETTKKAVEEAVKAVEDGNAVILDLSFVKDNQTVQPGKEVSVTLPVPEALKTAAKVYIYHVGEDSITLVASPDVKNGTVTFSTSNFSPFIISGVELVNAAGTAEVPDDTGTANPETGIALAIAPVMLAAGAVVVIAKKRR